MSFCSRIGSTLTAFSTLALVTLTGCDTPDDRDDGYTIPDQPEMETGYNPKPGWEKEEFAVAAANPLATDAGYQIIQQGGNAIDAAVAVQMVLTLAEPQSSGIGGGAFLLNYDGSEIQTYNGREKAPADADGELFYIDGEELSFSDAVHSGLSVGVPGTVAMLEQAHEESGNLPWDELFEPAITLAEEGFEISPRLHGILDRDENLRDDDIARELYYDDDGEAHPVGYQLQNPALAEVLQNIAEDGSDYFYSTEVAESIVERVRDHERPGLMTVEDIQDYPNHDTRMDAICTDWRDYEICGFPPPSSGHLTMMQAIGILENVDEPEEALEDTLPSADWLHNYMEAAKLSFADRNQYIADPDFVDAPGDDWETMLDPDYLAQRASLIEDETMGEADYGTPGAVSSLFGTHPEQIERGTSHISIVDREGNAVSMTTTIEQGFGSRIMSDGGTGLTGGFHLNNELTDFSRTPEDADGNPIANRVEGGKRPRSSMTPTLIFEQDTGDFVASVGSPGGAGIIHYTAKAVIGMLDWELNPQDAIDLPNFANYNNPAALLESDYFPDETFEALEARGHDVEERNMTSGLQAIQRMQDGILFGGADPRREGIVKGE